MTRKEHYIDLNYKPKDDIICIFRIEPAKGISMKEAADTVALESSTGTWTDVKRMSYMRDLGARVFSIEKNLAYIAYPSELFERGNVPQILSSVAGNVFGMKAVRNLKLEDVAFPKSILRGFSGPYFGIDGIRKIMRVKERPFVGTIIKPKIGLKTKDHAKCAYEAWRGGCDYVKDDENLSSQGFNEFEERLVKTLEAKDKAESETGEKKAYLINVTAETYEMIRRAELVKKHGGKFIMVDVLTAGFSGLQSLRNANLKLAIHGHRAMHAAMTRNKKHGISMMVIADFCRLIGIDQLHIGTGIGKMEGGIQGVKSLQEEIEKQRVNETKLRLSQNWGSIKPTLAVCSGGLYPGHVPYLVWHLGRDIVLQMGGGIHAHPRGSEAGARAARQAVDAVMFGIKLKEYAKKHKELREALRLWGRVRF